MKKLISFAFFLLSITYSSAQEERVNYLSLGFGPVGIADPLSRSFNFIVEKNLTNNITWEITYGLWPDYIFQPVNARTTGMFQHEYRTSFRYIPKLANLEKNNLFFIGMEYSGVFQDYKSFSDEYRTASGDDLSYQSARVRRVVNGLRIESGVKLIRGWKELEIYGGIGIRHLDVRFTDVLPRAPSADWEPIVNYIRLEEGNYWRPDLHVGIKLCYTIRKYK